MTINTYKSGAWGLALAVEIFTRSIDVHLLILNISICFNFRRRRRK